MAPRLRVSELAAVGVNLGNNLPIGQLAAIFIGLPLIAATGGWLLAGRQLNDIAHQPIE